MNARAAALPVAMALMLAPAGQLSDGPPNPAVPASVQLALGAVDQARQALTRRAPLANLVAARLADPRFAGKTVGASVWVDGFGEVGGTDGDVALMPASNEKIFTAMGALGLVGRDTTLDTIVRAAGPVHDGVLEGDLVLIGGGDPYLQSSGPHSLDDLASQVRAKGIVQVTGQLVGDDSHFDDLRTARGWLSFHIGLTGPLSALTVDGNRYRNDPDFLAHPAPANAELFRLSLQRRGVRVQGASVGGVAPIGAEAVARLPSEPVGALVAQMLNISDNLTAELLLKEVGARAHGRGSSEEGAAATATLLSALAGPLEGSAADGSGLSRENRRSPREWRRLLQAAPQQRWWDAFAAGLPVAGRSGTLSSRFVGTLGEGTVRAKTGSIREGRALSGYATTRAGRAVVFSVVVNGPQPDLGPIDDLVLAVLADRS